MTGPGLALTESTRKITERPYFLQGLGVLLSGLMWCCFVFRGTEFFAGCAPSQCFQVLNPYSVNCPPLCFKTKYVPNNYVPSLLSTPQSITPPILSFIKLLLPDRACFRIPDFYSLNTTCSAPKEVCLHCLPPFL